MAKIYKPSLFRERLERYSSKLTLIPNANGANIVQSYSNYLINPTTDNARYVSCPSIVGQDSICSNIFFKLCEIDRDEKNFFKRINNYYCGVKIVEDRHHPELEGQIVILQFNNNIYKKLQEMSDPFNTDKLFNLDIELVDGYPNYNSSGWVNKEIKDDYFTTHDNITAFLEYSNWSHDDKSHVANVIYQRLWMRGDEEMRAIYSAVMTQFPDIDRRETPVDTVKNNGSSKYMSKEEYCNFLDSYNNG